MRQSRRTVSLGGVCLGLVLGLGVGCEIGDLGMGDIPPATSTITCYSDSDCATDACCGQGSEILHRSEAPSCSNVSCGSLCPAGTPSYSVDCGRCIPVCRDSRCAPACNG